MRRLHVCLLVCALGASGDVTINEAENEKIKGKKFQDNTESVPVFQRRYGENGTAIAVNIIDAASTVKPNNTVKDYVTFKQPKKYESSLFDYFTKDASYIDFDEILNNIAVDSKNFTRKKPLLDINFNDTSKFDDVYLQNVNTINNREDIQGVPFLDSIEGNEVTESSTRTEVAFDLLEAANKRGNIAQVSINDSDIFDTFNFNNFYDIENNDSELSLATSLNIMKREVLFTDANKTKVNPTLKVNITRTFEELQENVLSPLQNIIKEKQEEIDELLAVRDKIVKLLDGYKNKDVVLTEDINKILDILSLIDFINSDNFTFDKDFNTNMEVKLNFLDNKIQHLHKCLKNMQGTNRSNKLMENMEQPKNESTIKQIMFIITNARKAINSVIRNKFYDIRRDKELAKKTKEEKESKMLKHFEDVMLMWQKHLNLVPRRIKRFASGYRDIKGRMKDIIPKYLRGKLSPNLGVKAKKKSRATQITNAELTVKKTNLKRRR